MSGIAPIDPSSAALLVMDLQHGTLAPLPDSEALIDRIQRARTTASTAGIQIVHVRVAFSPDQRAAIPDRNKTFAPVVSGGYFAHDSQEAQIHPDAAPLSRERVFTKTRVGALSTTELDAFLDERGVDTLILAGVHTSGAVLSTVRDAADRDYRLLVLADCCADPDPDLHQTLMTRIFPSQADVIDTSMLDNLLAARPRSAAR